MQINDQFKKAEDAFKAHYALNEPSVETQKVYETPLWWKDLISSIRGVDASRPGNSSLTRFKCASKQLQITDESQLEGLNDSARYLNLKWAYIQSAFGLECVRSGQLISSIQLDVLDAASDLNGSAVTQRADYRGESTGWIVLADEEEKTGHCLNLRVRLFADRNPDGSSSKFIAAHYFSVENLGLIFTDDNNPSNQWFSTIDHALKHSLEQMNLASNGTLANLLGYPKYVHFQWTLSKPEPNFNSHLLAKPLSGSSIYAQVAIIFSQLLARECLIAVGSKELSGTNEKKER